MSITIYGYSDDLIEIDGDIYDEFGLPYNNDGAAIACSNGVLLRIVYDQDGIWRITPLAGGDKVSVWQCPAEYGLEYSDKATVEGTVTWVALATDYVNKKN